MTVGHIHIGLIGFIVTAIYVAMINLSARLAAGHLAHTPLGRAIAFLF